MLNKLKLVNYYITIEHHKLFFNPIKNDDQEDKGFDFYIYENKRYQLYIQGSNLKGQIIVNYIELLNKNKNEAFSKVYSYFKELFQIYVWDKNILTFYTITDYLGVGTNYVYKTETKTVFFSNFLKLESLESYLKIVPDDLYTYLAIGYKVKPFRLPFVNVNVHEGNVLYEYSNNLIKEKKIKSVFVTQENIGGVLKSSIDNIDKCFFGATAGKDSLVLIALIKKSSNKILGNFGDKNSADVKQGSKIAIDLGVDYLYKHYASKKEFKEYSNIIANISGGLTTTSYVDMLCFVNKTIPENYTYIMGEGGECIRDFFTGTKGLEASLEDYITPIEYLNKTLKKSCQDLNIKKKLLEQIERNYKGNSIEETLLNFYRKGRMPGNFSNRHKIISNYKAKHSPFLNYDFIMNTYSLDKSLYLDSKIHKKILEIENNNFVKWFNNPIKTAYSSQNLEARYKEYIADFFRETFYAMSETSQIYFNKKALLTMVENQLHKPDRGMYYLLRVISFIIFIDNNEHCFVTN